MGAPIRGALRHTTLAFASAPIPLIQPDPLSPSQMRFDVQPMVGSFLTGDLEFENYPFAGYVRHNLAGGTLSDNLWPEAGFFEWSPSLGPGLDYVAGEFWFHYKWQPPGIPVLLHFTGQVEMTGAFSSANYAPVSTEGGTVELLGGATAPGGVTVMIDEVIAEGTFVAQHIGLGGLPVGALETALETPDLAYSLGLVGYTTPIWNLDFTGEAAGIDVTLGYADYTTPNLSESRLVLYHFNQLGEWEQVAGQILDTQANTIRFTATEFSPFLLAVSVPEPASAVAAGIGLAAVLGLVVGRRKRQVSATGSSRLKAE